MTDRNEKISLDAETHIFKIGQAVRMKAHTGIGARIRYRVTGTLPARGNSPQYRIRNSDEDHERVVTQDLIEETNAPPEEEIVKLTDRVFRELTKISTPSKRSTSRGRLSSS